MLWHTWGVWRRVWQVHVKSWSFACHLCVHNDATNFLSSCWLHLFRYWTVMYEKCLLIKGLTALEWLCRRRCRRPHSMWCVFFFFLQVGKLICRKLRVRCNWRIFYFILFFLNRGDLQINTKADVFELRCKNDQRMYFYNQVCKIVYAYFMPYENETLCFYF